MTGRGLRGRRTARLLLGIAIGLDALVVFLFLTAPHTMGGGFDPPSIRQWLIPAAGVVANVVGLLWMARIYRADREAHPAMWRYRR